jgi:alkanesulfonate monooxygenase SsuD/methylene tetrahydromethanopterin reductase-like flavin-dependent oxidoreductase (luciferase family)
MELGFALPHLGPIATRDNIRQLSIEAERLGYHSLWTNERLLKPVHPKTPYPGTGGCSRVAIRDGLRAPHVVDVRLGADGAHPPRGEPDQPAVPSARPARERIATMDHLSGRLDIGLGLGWSEDEADVTGTPFADRGRRAAEYIDAIKVLWGPDPVEFHGRYLDVPLTEFGPKPVHQAHPPLYVGAFTPVALKRAGRVADGFTACCAPVDAILAMRQAVQDAATTAGRDGVSLPTVVRCLVHRTHEPLPDDGRPVAHGTWDQIHEDCVRLDDAGVEVTFLRRQLRHRRRRDRGAARLPRPLPRDPRQGARRGLRPDRGA